MEYGVRPEGKVKITKEGLYTVLEADIPDKGSLLRLYVCGSGKTAELGLIPPGGRLLKKFSSLQMKSLPEKELSFFTLKYDEKPGEAESFGLREAKKDLPDNNCRTSIWEQLPDGSMRALKDGFTYIALPAELRKRQAGIRLMRWKDREYIVFRY